MGTVLPDCWLVGRIGVSDMAIMCAVGFPIATIIRSGISNIDSLCDFGWYTIRFSVNLLDIGFRNLYRANGIVYYIGWFFVTSQPYNNLPRCRDYHLGNSR